MEFRTLVLVLAIASASRSSTVCPQGCKCYKNNYSGTVAKCTELDPDIQKFSSDITHLVVENFIGEKDVALTPMIFADMGLDRVATIKIVNSTLRDIDVNAFHGLTHLQEVNFSHNRLILIHPDTFKNNKRLERVVLKGNPLQLTQVLDQKGHHFLNSNSLRELDLSHCGLTQIAPKTFSNLENLELLDLSGNDLTEIKADTLANLVNLEDLYLAHNSISKIDPNAFIDIEDMTKLSLRGNPIKTLEGVEISGLAELDVSECDFEILAAATFDGFQELNTLNLSRNSIRDIDPEAFYSLTNLKYIDLSYNMIRGPLDRSLFTLNKKLETISLAGNKEMRVFREMFGTFPHLYYFDLSDCGLIEVMDESFNNMHNLAKLNLSNNYLQHIRPHLFEPLTHLTVLDLSNNRLHFVNDKLFSGNKKLMRLSLAGNAFRHVPAALFEKTPDLEWLDLSNCRLITLWNITEAFDMRNNKIFRNLHYLNVSGNKLVKLHRHSFISMENLEKLDISNNPIQCTNDFSHLMQWLIVNSVMPNKGNTKHSTNLGFIANNIEWDEVLKVVCPINTQNSHKAINHKTLFKNTKNPEGKLYQAEKIPIHELIEPISFKGPEELTKIEPIEEPPLVWPMVLIWISILSIFIALGNLIGLLIYRSRRQYRVLNYRSPFTTSPLDNHFNIRRGNGRSPYQKLYEECSVPAPVHDKKIKIVTILENAFNKNNSKV
ncbi:hypothetical protein O3M35_009288 [Rhynocoris fuscipes]|uniref:Uncharacterized protein n=1 Tax=Rhynocoris fuscipes TaxID=488301 RepID=A0AAW1D538_9HEMI